MHNTTKNGVLLEVQGGRTTKGGVQGDILEGRTTSGGVLKTFSFASLEPNTEVARFTEPGEYSFEVPATGRYEIEMHGGGGGAMAFATTITIPNPTTGQPVTQTVRVNISGSGSGEIYTLELLKGESYPVTVGKGADALTAGSMVQFFGETTSFGDKSLAGGGSPSGVLMSPTIGASSGSIATQGSSAPGIGPQSVTGGYGNKDKPSQTYGNGGSVVSGSPQNGSDGAVIVTYLGK